MIVQENMSRRFHFLSSRLNLSVVQLSSRCFVSSDSCHISLLLRPPLHSSSSCSHTCVSNSALDPHPEPTEDGLAPSPQLHFLTRQFHSHSVVILVRSVFRPGQALQQTALQGILTSLSCLFFLVLDSLSLQR